MALQITDANVNELINGDKPVVIDLWAEWCGPCRAIAPVIEELATEYDGRVVIGKYNVDEDTELSEKFSVRNIPTLLFFKNGQLIDKQVGASKKQDIAAKIESLL